MPPKQPRAEDVLSKYMGKETSDALLSKIDKMTAEGATPAKIESAIYTDISAELEKRIVSAVLVNIGPIQPIKVNTIQHSVRTTIGPPIRVSTGVQVRVTPPTYTKGTR